MMPRRIRVWKDIEGYEGHYQVSNYGEVRSLDRTTTHGHMWKSRIRKPAQHSAGYLIISLWKGNKEKIFYVHRLVGQAFIPCYQRGSIINHKDGNRKNNCIDNLEWVSYKDNSNHARDILHTIGQRVRCLSTGKVYSSQSAAARDLGVSAASVSLHLNGKRRTAKGFLLEWLDVKNSP